MKARKSRSAIGKIKDSSGVWVENVPDIHNLFVTDFASRFKSCHDTSSLKIDLPTEISLADNINLIKPVEFDEIQAAVFQMDKYKAPGSDGFGAAFFQDHWHVISKDVCRAIQSFFQDGKLLKQLNHTLIALIPKVDHPTSTSQFRPISLCTTLYKIIAKILVNRMRPLLEKIIDPVQSAFVPHRSIHDNILLAHEIINKFNAMKGKKSWVALKLDMEKAYDRMEWNFLFESLKQFGFHQKWISWIHQCVTTVSYSIIINDEVTGFFTPSRGLRQGDPLSPYLFLICMEVLTRQLRAQLPLKRSDIGFKISPHAAKLPCLLFADDSLLFCRTNLQSCQKLSTLLTDFCHKSGQLINFHKSSLTFSKNATTHDRQIVSSIFNIKHQDHLGKYLGCPVFKGRPTTDTFSDLITKTTSKLQNWKTTSISKAGRVALIQTNLESLPAHTMQCFRLPYTTSRTIDKISRDFFWKKSATQKGLPMVSWDKICRPKQSGGLGLRKTEAVNSAFLSKLTWKLFNETGLWQDQMIAKYPINETFFKAQPRQADSWVWKCILKNRPEFRKGIRWKVGDGTRINFWLDNWCDNHCLATIMHITDFDSLDTSLKVSEFILPNSAWDMDKLQGLVNSPCLQLILATPIPANPIPDSICWGLSGSGEFTTKSATWAAHGLDLRHSKHWAFSWIWKLDIMPKLKVFLWQLGHSSLPTRGNLLFRGLDIDPLCPHCNATIETTEYLFLECPHAQATWQLARNHQWITTDLSLDPQLKLADWLSHLRHSLPSHQMVRLVALLWSLWKTRNSVVFRNETSTPGMSLLRAKRASAEWRIRHKLSLPYHPPLPHHSPHNRSSSKWIMWRKPPGGFVKLNFDGSKSSQGAAGGYLIRDWTGRFLQAASFNLGCSSVLVAEATALRNGVQAAVKAGFQNIHIEGDNRTLIQAVLKEIHVPWEIQVLVQDISTFIPSFTHVVINHTYRQGNRAADWLAKFGLSVHSTHVWHGVPPRELFPFLFDDNLGRALERRAS